MKLNFSTDRYRHRLLAVAIITSLSFLVDSALRMLTQLYLKELEASPIIISLGMSLLWLGILMGSALWGFLADRFSRRMILIVVLIGSFLTLGFLILLLPPSVFLAFRFVYALIMIGIVPATLSLVSSSASSSNRGGALSRIGFSRALGVTMGKLVGGFLLVIAGFRWSFATMAVLPIVALPIALALPRAPKKPMKKKNPLLAQLVHKRLRGLYLGVMLSEMGAVGSFSLVFVYMAILGIQEGTMGLVNALAPGMAMIGMLFSGRIADRVGRRKVFAIGFGLFVLGPLIFAFAHNSLGMGLGFALIGLSFGPYYIGSTAHIGDLIPVEHHGSSLGLFESSRAVGGVIGPLIAGGLVSILGFQGMFIVMASLAFLGFILVLFQAH
jgi:MFS family permease